MFMQVNVKSKQINIEAKATEKKKIKKINQQRNSEMNNQKGNTGQQ